MIDRCNYLRTQQFLQYLQEVKGLKDTSLRRYRQHLNHLLHWADNTLLNSVEAKRPTLLNYVNNLSKETGGLSQESKSKIIEIAKQFFIWAKMHHETEFRKLPPAWIDTVRMPKAENQQAENVYVSLVEILQIARMTVEKHDLVMQRDQAAAVMLYLSGMRAGAFASAPIQAFDLENCLVYQWPKEYGVKTKNGKKATTYLLPIPELLEVVRLWHKVISAASLPTAPWYAPIQNEWGAQTISYKAIGKNRPVALNKRLRKVFKAAKLPYKSAHKFRHGTAVYGRQQAKDMSAYKALSMNLMHNDIRTTDGIYAAMGNDEVASQIALMTPMNSSATEIGRTDSFDGLSRKEFAKLLNEASRRLDE